MIAACRFVRGEQAADRLARRGVVRVCAADEAEREDQVSGRGRAY